MNFRPAWLERIDFAAKEPEDGSASTSWFFGWLPDWWLESQTPGMAAFGFLCIVLLLVAMSNRRAVTTNA
jgi:hypothetical protein